MLSFKSTDSAKYRCSTGKKLIAQLSLAMINVLFCFRTLVRVFTVLPVEDGWLEILHPQEEWFILSCLKWGTKLISNSKVSWFLQYVWDFPSTLAILQFCIFWERKCMAQEEKIHTHRDRNFLMWLIFPFCNMHFIEEVFRFMAKRLFPW